MKKLSFLVGKWTGEARLLRGPDTWIAVTQTEEAHYRLDGLILVIEGVGLSKGDGKPVLQAFAVITYDEATGAYRIRAFNDGRFLESEVTLLDDDKSLRWGFVLGQIRTSSTLRINEGGERTESSEITFGSQPPNKLMQLTVRRER